MPQGDAEVSPAEVEALFARLRAEIRSGLPSAPTAHPQDSDGQSASLASRDEAERLWAITADGRILRGPGLKGAVAYPIKRALRPFLRWYFKPALVEQRQFNATLLRLIDELAERLEALERRSRNGGATRR